MSDRSRPRLRVLVTGAGGQVGGEVSVALRGRHEVTATTRGELDLTRPDEIRAAFRAIRPDVVINAAAYTAVDRAESEPEACAAINAEAPRVMAEESARSGALLIHFSTDYVFDGRQSAPYRETDEPNPLNVYGRTKLAGELSIAAVGGAFFVLRTSWVYAHAGRNFVRRILALARQREELRVVRDQAGAPTWARDLAQATAALVDRAKADESDRASNLGGLYHLTSAGEGSWLELAAEVLELDPQRDEQRCRRAIGVSSAEFGALATHPASSRLDCSRAADVLGIRIGDWRERLRAAFAASPLTPQED